MTLKFDIIKLNGESNWLNWKCSIKSVLMANGLYKTILGTDTAGNVDEQTARKYLALAHLVTSLSPHVMNVINRTSEDPKEIYDALIARFEPNNHANIANLRDILQDIKMSNKESMQVYIGRIKDLVDQLAALGHIVPDVDQIYHLIHGLPDKYMTLRSVIGMTPTASLKLAAIISFCLAEERNLNRGKTANNTESDAALVVKHKFKGTCFNCGKPGHRANGCPFPKKSNTNQQSSKPADKPQYNKSNGNNTPKNANNNAKQGKHYAAPATVEEREDSPEVGLMMRVVDQKPVKPSVLDDLDDFDTFDLSDGSVVSLKKPEQIDDKGLAAKSEDLTVHSAGLAVKPPDNSFCSFKAEQWLIDSGASVHMTPTPQYLWNYTHFDKKPQVIVGDGRGLQIAGVGAVKLKLPNGVLLTLNEVFFVPGLQVNLFSVRAANSQGVGVNFNGHGCSIFDRDGDLITSVPANEKLYTLDCEIIKPEYHATSSLVPDLEKWHRRLAHVNEATLKKMAKEKLVLNLNLRGKRENLPFCESCVNGKIHRKPHPPIDKITTTRVLEKIHSDVCGPLPVESFGRALYFVTFIDDYSRHTSVAFIRSKTEVLQKFKDFKAKVENFFGQKIKILKTDNGTEYVNDAFKDYLREAGITTERSAPYVHAQLGIAERRNRSIMEVVRAYLYLSGLPKCLWAEAVNAVVYIQNRIVHRVLGVTPHERYLGFRPDVSHLRTWGCVCYSFTQESERTKLDFKARKLRFVGYSDEHKAYKLYDPETQQFYTRSDVEFDEDDFGTGQRSVSVEIDVVGGNNSVNNDIELVKLHPSLDDSTLEAIPRLFPDQVSKPKARTEVRHSSRPKKQPARVSYTRGFKQQTYYVYAAIIEPNSYAEVLKSPERDLWLAAMGSEYGSLMEMQTWILVKRPRGRNIISCKWIFRVKKDGSGKIIKYKARLVARGFSQVEGEDFDETYSPVVKHSSIRLLLAFAVQHGFHIIQADCVCAYLNGRLEETNIFMEQPPGYNKGDDLVCQLQRSLYGLRQSALVWFETLTNFLTKIGFQQSKCDPCCFIYRNNGKFAILSVYVDDLCLFSRDLAFANHLKDLIADRFKMTDLGEIHFVLGINVSVSPGCIAINQSSYILKMLERFQMSNANEIGLPMDPNVKLVKEDGSTKVDPVRLQTLIGSLLYCACGTRPDIAFAVSAISKFCSCPTETHISAAKRILRYLKATIDYNLQYTASDDGEVNTQLIGLSDASWGSDTETRRSVTGYVYTLSGGAISWKSQKQSIVALSTTESEYIALSSAVQEGVWLQHFMAELTDSMSSVNIFCDNQSTLCLATNPVVSQRSKHIDIRVHAIRDRVRNKEVILAWCPTDKMTADILTKPLPKERFERFRNMMGVVPPRVRSTKSTGLASLAKTVFLMICLFLFLATTMANGGNSIYSNTSTSILSNYYNSVSSTTAPMTPPTAPAMQDSTRTKMIAFGSIRLINNYSTTILKRQARSIINCDATFPRKILQQCSIAMFNKLYVDEEKMITMLNSSFATFMAEANTELQIHLVVLHLLKDLNSASSNKILINKLETLIRQFSNELNTTKHDIDTLNVFARQLHNNNLFIPDIIRSNASHVAVLALFFGIISLIIDCLLLIKIFMRTPQLIQTIVPDNNTLRIVPAY